MIRFRTLAGAEVPAPYVTIYVSSIQRSTKFLLFIGVFTLPDQLSRYLNCIPIGQQVGAEAWILARGISLRDAGESYRLECPADAVLHGAPQA